MTDLAKDVTSKHMTKKEERDRKSTYPHMTSHKKILSSTMGLTVLPLLNFKFKTYATHHDTNYWTQNIQKMSPTLKQIPQKVAHASEYGEQCKLS